MAGMVTKRKRSPFIDKLTFPVGDDRFTVYEKFLMDLPDDEYYDVVTRSERAFRKEVKNNIEG